MTEIVTATRIADTALAAAGAALWRHIAQMPAQSPEAVGQWLWTAVACALIVAALAKGWNEIIKAFGRKPPLDVIIAELSASIGESVTQVEFMALKTTIMPRSEIEREINRIDNQAQESIHGLRATLAGIVTGQAEEREHRRQEFTRMDSRLNDIRESLEERRSASVGNLHQQLKETEKKLARMEAAAEANGRKIDSMDAKIDRILERAADRK